MLALVKSGMKPLGDDSMIKPHLRPDNPNEDSGTYLRKRRKSSGSSP